MYLMDVRTVRKCLSKFKELNCNAASVTTTLTTATTIFTTSITANNNNNNNNLAPSIIVVKVGFFSDVWLTVDRNSVWIRITNKKSLFVFLISLVIVSQHGSGNHVPIIRS